MNGQASLRVLVVLPLYGGSLPVGRYAATALRDLGHTVDVFEAPAFYSAFSALRMLRVTSDRQEALEHSFLQVISQAIRARVEVFEPDLVLCLAQAPVSRQLLKTLARDKVTTAMWFVEDYRVFPYWRAVAPLYDFFFVIQKEPFFEKLAAAGARAAYLPLAALPSFHRPLGEEELSVAERRHYGSAVSFMGAGYPNRRRAFRQLSHLDFKIWGSNWNGEVSLAPFLQDGGARIEPEQAIKIFNASAINLNLHSSVQAKELVPAGDFVNPRTFEIACCGAFQLVDRRGLLPELFREDELATFTSMPELLDAIPYYLARPDERRELAMRGRARVLAEHTYQHRMAALVEEIRRCQPDWPTHRPTMTLPADLPEDLRRDLAELLRQLELPGDVAFEDVVTRLRQRNGVLNPLETSLLFLDEWRKQYRK